MPGKRLADMGYRAYKTRVTEAFFRAALLHLRRTFWVFGVLQLTDKALQSVAWSSQSFSKVDEQVGIFKS